MTRVCLHLVLLGSIATAIAPVHALAQPAQAVDKKVDKKQVAKQYVDAGLAAQNSGDYDTAITFYQKAYQLVPHPVLIFNIAQAHRLAHREDQAVSLYKRYLTEDPSGPQAQTARDILAEIDARKAAEAKQAEDARKAAEAKKVEDARKAEEARKAAEAKKAEDARKARELEAARTNPPSAAPAATTQDTGATGTSDANLGRTLRIAGIATGAGGAAALIVGTGFGLHARSLSSELSKPGATYDPSKVSSGRHANTIAIVGLAGGTALIAAGAAMYWWGYTHDRPAEKLALAPLVSGEVTGLVLSGTLP